MSKLSSPHYSQMPSRHSIPLNAAVYIRPSSNMPMTCFRGISRHACCDVNECREARGWPVSRGLFARARVCEGVSIAKKSVVNRMPSCARSHIHGYKRSVVNPCDQCKCQYPKHQLPVKNRARNQNAINDVSRPRHQKESVVNHKVKKFAGHTRRRACE